MRFEFATATRILFGPGTSREVAAAAATMGRRALVVTGRDPARSAPIIEGLNGHGVTAVCFAVSGEPKTDTALAGAQLAREGECDLVVGVGGGSVIDSGKAVATLLANGGEPLDYLEVIGRGQPLTRPSAPYIAVPTTAGTGAEVTRNAVLASPEHGVKVSLRSPLMLPRLAVVDPELTHSMPPEVTASTGLDALTQLIEPFVSNRANPMTDAVCREGMRRGARSLRRAYTHGDDGEARQAMSLASLFGGLALANAGLGAAHGFAGPIGGLYPAPHGAICARLLPFVMETNIGALRARASGGAALERYDEVAKILTGDPDAVAEDGIGWVQALCADLNVPPLSRYGLGEADVPRLVAQARKASSMKGNPIALADEELSAILRRAL